MYPTRQLQVCNLRNLTILLSDTSSPNPVAPCYVSLEDIDALVAGLVTEIFKEDSACEEGELDCFDMDVGAVSVPGVCTDDVGDDKAEDSVEEEEEEDDDDDDDDEFEEEDPTHRISKC